MFNSTTPLVLGVCVSVLALVTLHAWARGKRRSIQRSGAGEMSDNHGVVSIRLLQYWTAPGLSVVLLCIFATLFTDRSANGLILGLALVSAPLLHRYVNVRSWNRAHKPEHPLKIRLRFM